MKIKIFTTGGTIDKIYFDAKSEFQVGDPGVVGLLQEAHVAFEYAVESILRKDSLDITAQDRSLIHTHIADCDCGKVLLTHGTDTMVETARSLLDIKDKCIVLTGAMQPAALRYSDASFNIGSALMALHLLPTGVYIAMHGRIFNPLSTHKNLAQNRFEQA